MENDLPEYRENAPGQRQGRFLRAKHIIVILLIGVIVPVAAVGWTDLYKNFLERQGPRIVATEMPRGVGISPVSLKLLISDDGAGLDEVVVRVRQRGPSKELKRESLKGKKSSELVIDLDGEKSEFEEGLVNLQVRAFDRSFWSNTTEVNVPLRVDYRKPRVEVVTTQHNARHGGSQLLFYRAFDEDLAVSGVKVGRDTFFGFPASGLDQNFNEPNLFVAIYAISMEQDSEKVAIKVFAEDKVGNAVSTGFYNKVLPRAQREQTLKLDDQSIRERIHLLADVYRSRRAPSQGEESGEGAHLAALGSAQRLKEDFKIVNEKLRTLNETEVISDITRAMRQEAYWSEPFLRQPASSKISFSDKIQFSFEGNVLGESMSKGEDLSLVGDQRDVLAACGGIVVLADQRSIYGWTVAIDHGLGVATIYAGLDRLSVRKGEEVKRGQAVGVVGNTGLSFGRYLHYETRVQGIPVDSREWWETQWFLSHIVGKTNDVKRSLGIPVYAPLR